MRPTSASSAWRSCEVAPAFEHVVGALEELEAAKWHAEGYANIEIPKARAEAADLRDKAATHTASMRLEAPARAEQFDKQLEAYRAAPEAYMHRALLSAIEETLAGARKVFISGGLKAGGVRRRVYLNLKDRVRSIIGPSLEGDDNDEGVTP